MKACNSVMSIILTLVPLAACTSTAIPGLDQTKEVPPARLYWPAKKSDGHLILFGQGSRSEDCAARILVDGKLAADLKSGEIAHIGLTIGAHEIKYSFLKGCEDLGEDFAKISVKAGDAIIIKVGEDISQIESPSSSR